MINRRSLLSDLPDRTQDPEWVREISKADMRKLSHDGINNADATETHRKRACDVMDEWISQLPGDTASVKRLATLVEARCRLPRGFIKTASMISGLAMEFS
jgi:hypothetical protein